MPAARGVRLATSLSKALRAMDGGETSDLGAAVGGLAGALSGTLAFESQVSLLRVGDGLCLGERTLAPRNPQDARLLSDLHAALAQRGIGALLLGGGWTASEVIGLLDALNRGSGPPTARVQAIAEATRSLPEPALAVVLDEQQAAAFTEEDRARPHAPRARASSLYARLIGLAQVCLAAIRSNRSLDVHDVALRTALRRIVEALVDPTFERRLLALGLMPPLPHVSHLANVTCLSLAMGRLLGLSRAELLNLGYAAFFHDVGRAGSGPPTVGEDGASEGADAARRHLTNGVRLCLSGRNTDDAGILRVVVALEHHKRSHGLPQIDQAAHVASEIVAVADAFDVLEAGRPWRGPLAPDVALREIEGCNVYDPAAVNLLAEVLGRRPRGSLLRVDGGAVVVVLDGGARRGHRPITKVIMDASGGAPGTLVAVADESAIGEDDLDPAQFGLKTWKIVLGRGAPAEEEDHLGILPPLPAPPQPDAGRVLACRKLVEALLKAVRVVRHHPPNHSRRQKTLHELERARTAAQGGAAIQLLLRREGIYLADAELLPPARARELLDTLRPHGVRQLTLQADLDASELGLLVEALAQGGRSEDGLTPLWACKLPNVFLSLWDPFAPEELQAARNPLEGWLYNELRNLNQAIPDNTGEEDVFCTQVLRSESQSLSPCANPEAVAEFLASEAGAERRLLVERYRADDLALRASRGVRWAETQEPAPDPDDVARFMAALVRRSLWSDDLDTSIDLLAAVTPKGGHTPAAHQHLATRETVELLLRRLRQGATEPDVGGGVAFLEAIGAPTVTAVCEVYSGLSSEEELRRLLATFLVNHIKTDPTPLVPLTLSRHPQVAREALILIGVGGPGSPGLTLLREFAGQGEKPNLAARAAVAQEVLDEVTGEGTQQADLETLAQGTDKAARVAAARRLRRGGDNAVFDALCELVRRKGFSQRDEDEIEQVLGTLADLGGGRAVRILEEFASKTKAFTLNKGTRRIGRAASGRLKALKASAQESKTERFNLKELCLRCKFENLPGTKQCLQCGTPLDRRPKKKPAPRVPAKVEPPPRAQAAAPSLQGGFASGAACAKTAPTSVVAWLSWPLLQPVPLGPKSIVVIGRSASSDLELVHDSVSREHAVIRVAGQQLTIEDRSSYGTWVNGDRVLTSALKVGDVITVGPFDINVEDAQAIGNRDTDTRPLRTFASSEAIGGRLERVSLAEVLQQIEFNAKTGTLEVFGDDRNGTLVIYEGKPVFAEMGDLRDDEAVIGMLSLKKGNFSFRAKIEAGEMTMSNTLTGILFEASRIIDESEIPTE